MKQKMVVRVTMSGNKSRSKALKIAVGLPGVESVSLIGDDKSQIELTGEEVDPVQLIRLLKNSLRHAELVSVSTVDGDKKEEKKEDEKPPVYVWDPNPPYYMYEVPHEPSCSIL